MEWNGIEERTYSYSAHGKDTDLVKILFVLPTHRYTAIYSGGYGLVSGTKCFIIWVMIKS